MLKDLNVLKIEPDAIYGMVASVNGVDLSNGNYFEQLGTGIYRHDGFMFNFDGFIKNNTTNKIIDEWVNSGVCDNFHQILDRASNILDNDVLGNPDRNFVIGLSTVEKSKQSSEGGWRWHKWGEYIGTQNPQCEYLYDEPEIDKVYCYHIYEIA